MAQSVQRLATGWTVRGSNRGGVDNFRTRPDRPWVSPSLLYSGYRVSFADVNWPGRGVNHPPSSSVEVKERVELYVFSISGHSWPILRQTFPILYLFPHQNNLCTLPTARPVPLFCQRGSRGSSVGIVTRLRAKQMWYRSIPGRGKRLRIIEALIPLPYVSLWSTQW
jgi:hypothetical protein